MRNACVENPLRCGAVTDARSLDQTSYVLGAGTIFLRAVPRTHQVEWAAECCKVVGSHGRIDRRCSKHQGRVDPEKTTSPV